MTARFAATLMLLLVVTVTLPLSAKASALDAPEPLQEGEVLRGAFVQERMLSGFDTPLHSAGHYMLAPGHGLLWQVKEPFPITTAITANGLVQTASDVEVTRLPVERVPALAHMHALLAAALAGDWSTLKNQFQATHRQSSAGWLLELVPLDTPEAKLLPIAGITLSGRRFVESVEIRRNNGDVERISFRDHRVIRQTPTPAEKALLDATGQ